MDGSAGAVVEHNYKGVYQVRRRHRPGWMALLAGLLQRVSGASFVTESGLPNPNCHALALALSANATDHGVRAPHDVLAVELPRIGVPLSCKVRCILSVYKCNNAKKLKTGSPALICTRFADGVRSLSVPVLLQVRHDLRRH